MRNLLIVAHSREWRGRDARPFSNERIGICTWLNSELGGSAYLLVRSVCEDASHDTVHGGVERRPRATRRGLGKRRVTGELKTIRATL